MLVLSFLVYIGLQLILTKASDNESKESSIYSRNDNLHQPFNTFITPLSKMSNKSYHEETDNLLLVPKFNQQNGLHINKKTLKKPPKRITQKIIKKSRSKSIRAYSKHLTSVATKRPDIDDNPIEEDLSNNDKPTTAPTEKKRKKWNAKRLRNPMPFQKLQPRNHKRNRRDTNRSDAYIFQDLDEIVFLSNEQDNNVVEAHIKRYW